MTLPVRFVLVRSTISNPHAIHVSSIATKPGKLPSSYTSSSRVLRLFRCTRLSALGKPAMPLIQPRTWARAGSILTKYLGLVYSAQISCMLGYRILQGEDLTPTHRKVGSGCRNGISLWLWLAACHTTKRTTALIKINISGKRTVLLLLLLSSVTAPRIKDDSNRVRRRIRFRPQVLS